VSTLVISVLALIIILAAAAIVGLVAFIVQRKLSSKWLRVACLTVTCLAPPVMYTSFLLTRVDYTVHALISYPVLRFAAANLRLWSAFCGVFVWHTVATFGPRPVTSGANGTPSGLLEDGRGLTGILRRYDALLKTYNTALDAADPNPFPLVGQAVLVWFRGFSPSSVRLAREQRRQIGPLPNINILVRDLTGAECVLAELEALTPAQLSAIEACHHVNVRRLHRRSIFGWGWRSKLAMLIAVAAGLVSAAEYVGVLKWKDIDLWSFISGITLMGTDTPSIIARSVIIGFLVMLVWCLRNGVYFLPRLQRLWAFEDILTIAKAYRKGDSETTKPSAKPSLTATG
jgi:hypothetical protein